ncbi:MAG: UDP-glucose 4-epimerase GalE [Bdellovibrionaceae bacterium]|nr:UDP-glucose 4-epimerase GalE [Pseudobdellovibrionaceae bacterium]
MIEKCPKILVTGGAGYIGSHLCRILDDSKIEYVVLDNFSTGFEQALPLKTKIYRGDISDLSILNKIFQENNIQSVMHFAAKISVAESIEKPKLYHETNYLKLVSFSEYCKEHGVSNFIFSSTAAVYGDLETEKVQENSPTKPQSPYGKSKLEAEKHLQKISDEQFNIGILRYFNVAGAHPDGSIGQSTKGETSLVKACALTAAGKLDSLHIFGTDYPTKDGTCERDFIHVMDLADIHIQCLEFLKTKKQSILLNCGYGRSFTVKEVVSSMKTVSGIDFKVFHSDRRAGDIVSSCSDTTLLQKSLNWSPMFNDLDEICKSAFQWEKSPKY